MLTESTDIDLINSPGKSVVAFLLKRLPVDATFAQIAEEIAIFVGVKQGLIEARAGKGMSARSVFSGTSVIRFVVKQTVGAIQRARIAQIRSSYIPEPWLSPLTAFICEPSKSRKRFLHRNGIALTPSS